MTLRVLGLDLGSRRIGVAVSDPSGTIASPYQVIERSGNASDDHDRIAEIVSEVGAERVVVGLPLSLSGKVGPAAEQTMREIEAMAEVVNVPVEVRDERFTSVSAQRSMRALGVRAGQRRASVDKVAAAVILQSWLDGRHR